MPSCLNAKQMQYRARSETSQDFCHDLRHTTKVSNLGQRIKEARQEAKMSRTELASILHVAERTVRGWEEGTREPSNLEMFKQIAVALKCDANYLLGLTT